MGKIQRVQCGARIEKRLLKVLKGLAEYLEISLGEALELCVLSAFQLPGGFSKGTQRKIAHLSEIYELGYGMPELRRRLFVDD